MGGEETWAEVNTTSGTTILYQSADTNSTKLKILPNAWAVKVLDDSGPMWQVLDVTDDTTGWIKATDLDKNTTPQQELKDRASVIYDTREKRIPVILEAVNLYHNNPNSSKSLFDPGGGAGDLNNFDDFITDGNFPEELFLAMTAHESGGHNFDNEICSVAKDGGIGIMQITSTSSKGVGSNLINHKSLNNYECFRSWPSAISKYYSNTQQGIYANIKDGYRTLQEKYNKARSWVDSYIPSKTSWFTSGDITISNTDLKKLLAVRGYNGFGLSCYRFNSSDYPKPVGIALENLNTYFPGRSYSNEDKLIEKLKLIDEHKLEISLCSPGILQIVDEEVRITGSVDGLIRYEIPNVVYNEEGLNAADILFPQGEYRIRIVGDERGIYSLYVLNKVVTPMEEFKALEIPIRIGEVHEYEIDWLNLQNSNGVIVRIDLDGDGIFERRLNSDSILTADELLAGLNKIVVCHIPPGNPAKAHTIRIGQPALKAHLAHDDTMGECPVATPTGFSPQGKRKKKQ